MAKTSKKATASKTKTAKRVTGKSSKKAATAGTSHNDARPKRKEMTTEEITLHAFRKVYESHREATAAAKAKTIEDAEQAAIDEAKRNGAPPAKLSEKIKRARLRSFQMAPERKAQKAATGRSKQVKPAGRKQTKRTVAAKRKKPQFGRMSEETKRLTILAFQMAYEQHQREKG